VVRVYAEDIVTGEIIAPVKRSRLVRYVEMFSEHRYGKWVLAAIAFADSSFLLIPPDLLLVPMALVRPKADLGALPHLHGRLLAGRCSRLRNRLRIVKFGRRAACGALG
jgi:hypothetical protein